MQRFAGTFRSAYNTMRTLQPFSRNILSVFIAPPALSVAVSVSVVVRLEPKECSIIMMYWYDPQEICHVLYSSLLPPSTNY
jgi:hypothetical protein